MGNKTKMTFGARVRMHREKILVWSMREAAENIGVSRATLSRIENGKTPDIYILAECKQFALAVAGKEKNDGKP